MKMIKGIALIYMEELDEPLRRTGIFGNEKIISRIFPSMNTIRSK